MTDGWGLHGHMFAWPWLDGHSLVAVWLILSVGFLASYLLGSFVSSIWMRWHSLGLLVGAVAAILTIGGLAVLVTWQRWWPELGSWFAGLTPLTGAGWLVLVSLVLAAANHLSLRHAEL